MTRLAAVLLAATFALCSPPAAADPRQPPPLDWLTGCWQKQDRSYKEIWTKADSGFMFGYAITYDATGAVTFFEQARIDLGPPAVYNAYPGGFGPSAFTESMRAKNAIAFTNAEISYPQKITYARDGRRMTATISLINDGRAETFEMRRCR